jgi:hypothetical protein
MTEPLSASPGDKDQPTRLGLLLGVRVALLAALGLAAGLFPVLALPACFILWIGWLSIPKTESPAHRLITITLGIAAVTAGVGLLRFVVEHAAAGIVSGGQTATSRRAISRLRELVFAQDMMRKHAVIDPDGDGVGSAGWIGELAGAVALRTGSTPKIPILNREWRDLVETPSGPAARVGGFLFLVCLPTSTGWTARPGDEIDEEAAERHFVAYAWPDLAGPGVAEAYFVNQHERILIGRAPDGASFPHVGPAHPPACDAGLTESKSLKWEVWKNKAPRVRLPGDSR